MCVSSLYRGHRLSSIESLQEIGASVAQTGISGSALPETLNNRACSCLQYVARWYCLVILLFSLLVLSAELQQLHIQHNPAATINKVRRDKQGNDTVQELECSIVTVNSNKVVYVSSDYCRKGHGTSKDARQIKEFRHHYLMDHDTYLYYLCRVETPQTGTITQIRHLQQRFIQRRKNQNDNNIVQTWLSIQGRCYLIKGSKIYSCLRILRGFDGIDTKSEEGCDLQKHITQITMVFSGMTHTQQIMYWERLPHLPWSFKYFNTHYTHSVVEFPEYLLMEKAKTKSSYFGVAALFFRPISSE